MIWDEIDSGHDFLAYTRVSKMLHGGGATEYFQHTQVSVKLMPRKSATPQVRFSGQSEQYAHTYLYIYIYIYTVVPDARICKHAASLVTL